MASGTFSHNYFFTSQTCCIGKLKKHLQVFCCLRVFVVVYKLAMGYKHIPSFIILGSCIYALHHFNGLYHNVWPRDFNSVNGILEECLDNIGVVSMCGMNSNVKVVGT